MAKGTNINNLKRDHILLTPLPLPPLAEQRRIVDAVETHFSRIDAAGKWLTSSEGRIQTLEKAILSAASSTQAPPAHWNIITVGEAGHVSLGLQRSPKRHSGPNMRPYLRVANVFEDRIDSADVMSMDMSDAEWTRYLLHDGDVLLNEGQSPQFLGRPAIYRGEPPEIAFTNSLIRFKANKDVDPEWALLIFRSHLHNRRFMRESQITTNIAHLAAGRFKTVEFPLPPLEEQIARVAYARKVLAGCHRLRDGLVTARRRQQVLLRSVLAQAFSGLLVPQDPNDEPADVLLQRIRTENSPQAGHKPRKEKVMA